MIPLGPVVARSRTKASRASVWAHLTDPNLRSEWWQALQLEPGLGGAVHSVVTADGDSAGDQARELEGSIDVWVAGHALGFTWQVPGEERGTAVLITLRSQGHHTGVTVTETGFDALPEGAVRADAAGRDWGRFVDALTAASLAEVDDVAAGGSTGVAASTSAASTSAATAEFAVANDTSELELAPLEIEGEIAAAPDDAPIEIDAEPNVGDRLELATGPVEVQDNTAASATDEPAPEKTESGFEDEEVLSEDLVPLVLPEPHEIPLVLPEPPGDIMTGAPASNDADESDESDESDVDSAGTDEVVEAEVHDDEEEEPEEPDFDSLLRGL